MVLLPKTYSAEETIRHLRQLTAAFRGSALPAGNRWPTSFWSTGEQLPDPAAYRARWRQECHALGIGEISLLTVEFDPGMLVIRERSAFD